MNQKGMSVFDWRFQFLVFLSLFLFLLLSLVFNLRFAGNNINHVGEMEVSVPVNGLLGQRYSGDNGISPPVEFVGVPDSARSLALVMEGNTETNIDAVYWVVWNIPVDGSLPEGLPNEKVLEKPKGAVQGTNDFEEVGYTGPENTIAMDRYSFQAYALDRELDLEPGSSVRDLNSEIRGSVVARAQETKSYQTK